MVGFFGERRRAARLEAAPRAESTQARDNATESRIDAIYRQSAWSLVVNGR
jgi:hypothetical protein